MRETPTNSFGTLPASEGKTKQLNEKARDTASRQRGLLYHYVKERLVLNTSFFYL